MKRAWNIFPEDPIKIQSVIEIVVFVMIFAICSFLFVRWNDVPLKDYKFRIEQIKTETDTVNQKRLDIRMAIPMTTHEELNKDTAFLTILPGLYKKSSTQQRLTDITFMIDRMLHGQKNDNSDLYNIPLSYAEAFGVGREFNMIYGSYKKNFNDLDSIYNVPFKVKEMKYGKPVYYLHTEINIPYGIFTGFKIKSNNRLYIIDSIGIQVSEQNKIKNRLLTSYYGIDGYVLGPFTFQSKKDNSWYRYINPFNIFAPSSSALAPSFLQLEDISQTYFNLELKTVTIDSINLVIDFVGATEFSKMDPVPDKITMSSIEFRDPAKLFKIRAHGLRFHAKFTELENRQTIRLFGVTAIMSGLLIIFITFVILLFFKLRRGSKGNSDDKDNKAVEEVDISKKPGEENNEEVSDVQSKT